MALARKSMTMSPTELVPMLETTRPPTYSEIASGVANKFKKLRDHTSSINAIVTPCITRVKKSQRRTAPSSTGTKSNPAELTAFKYLDKSPQHHVDGDPCEQRQHTGGAPAHEIKLPKHNGECPVQTHFFQTRSSASGSRAMAMNSSSSVDLPCSRGNVFGSPSNKIFTCDKNSTRSQT